MNMKPSDVLHAAADYIRKHGFSPYLGKDGCSRCFLGALMTTYRSMATAHKVGGQVEHRLLDIVGHVDPDSLIRDGWTSHDAIAALEIAADIAYAEGK